MTEQQANEQQPNTTKSRMRGDERRHALIVAAYQIIAEQGFEGLRVRDVADKVGVNIATLHYYFKTKEALVGGVVEHLLTQFKTIAAPIPKTDTETPIQQLQREFWDVQYQLQTAPEIFVVLSELHLRANRDPAISEILGRLNTGWQKHIQSICEEGVRQKLFRSDVDPQQTASIIVTLIKGIALQSISHLDFNLEQTVQDLIRLLQ